MAPALRILFVFATSALPAPVHRVDEAPPNLLSAVTNSKAVAIN